MPKLRRCLSTCKAGEESDSTHQGMGKWGNEVNGVNGLRGKVSRHSHDYSNGRPKNSHE